MNDGLMRAMKNMLVTVAVVLCMLCCGTSSSRAEQSLTEQEREFFESKIRPVLIEHCYECHNSTEIAEGELAVDHRQAFRKGGAGGAVVVPGKPDESRLLPVLRHEIEGMEMPQGGPKLEDEVIADFARWIRMGAPDPRDEAPTSDDVVASTSWDAKLARRKQWWSLQPISSPTPPDSTWSSHPIDGFVDRQRREAGLVPSEMADSHVLVRRLHFNLLGLPPSAKEAARWAERLDQASERDRQAVFENLVDTLLDSPRFGERWARHWMDWLRYAESHGSEGDPTNENAWAYRDYLIRALNADVPYDQLVREHVAGDLLEEPRRNAELGLNESAIGTAHWRMVFHGFAPTDALDERVRFTDDQINVFSKAFLGLTVSCARCHNHKFDAISQADYYALFGILASCRPGRQVVDLPGPLRESRDTLAALKPKVRAAVARDWLANLKAFDSRLDAAAEEQPESNGQPDSYSSGDGGRTLLHPIRSVASEVAAGKPFELAWRGEVEKYRRQAELWRLQSDREPFRHWNLAREADYAQWYATGTGLPERPHRAGEFAVAIEGDRALEGVYPAGAYSHTRSAKFPARLTSKDFAVNGDYELWVLATGDSQASLRYVVQDYPRSGTVYPLTRLSGDWSWRRFDLSYWSGDRLHIELATAKDAPLLTADPPRSWFGVREAMLIKKGDASPVESVEHLAPLMHAAKASPPNNVMELKARYREAVRQAVEAWQDDSATDAEALLLDACLRDGLLPNRMAALPTAASLLQQYRHAEGAAPVAMRIPGLEETEGRDQPLFVRGDHKQPGEPVPRRFLEAIDATPYDTQSSGRSELAEDLLRDDNPLTRRVIVNRVWHHLFGRGIVSTPDNLGRLGEQPTHPQLLDWMATRIEEDGWSLKRLIRLIVTSKTWRLSSQPSKEASRIDPENRWLSHARVRRLEAEVIRDKLLTVSGRVDQQLDGAPVAGHANRRSVYVRVIRNSLDPFLRAFDFPEPFSTVGRRDVTNVPAQSLAMMNNPRIGDYAESWAGRVLTDEALSSEEAMIRRMFWSAFGRPASKAELQRMKSYLQTTRSLHEQRRRNLETWESEIAEKRRQIESLLGPVRRRLEAQLRDDSQAARELAPKPVGSWAFDGNGENALAEADAELRGGASFDDGGLIVRNGGYAVTKPLDHTLREKTLEAWVQLDRLTQRGGGVMTVMTPDGAIFDAIVFGEKDPGQWLPGSNSFARTQSLQGERETAAEQQPVHVAIAYRADGTVAAYRDGKPYGRPYETNGPHLFEPGQTVVGFGVRHLPAGGNRLLSGRVLQANLYDRALTADEVARSAAAMGGDVSDAAVLASLDADSRRDVEAWRAEATELRDKVEEQKPTVGDGATLAVWSDLARVFFTMQEFIYVR